MPQTLKSALFIDCDSIRRRIAGRSAAAADAFGERMGEWLVGIETGQILRPPAPEGVRRRILMRRCYGDPKTVGADRARWIGSGFQVVDCPSYDGQDRSAAALHMALDANDALNHATGFDEFILLSADADLTPILFRLRAHNRNSIIYGTTGMSADYRAFADGCVEEDELLRRLGFADIAAQVSIKSAPAAVQTVAASPGEVGSALVTGEGALDERPYDREELIQLVRRIHHATRVPLFSPRVLADLFRLLAAEIAENGYRFQTTAENVADRLAAIGRSVTRRQVGFVVKGVALKGHMFSASDSAERLTEVFREQVLYLAKNANLTLSEREQNMVSAWILGRSLVPPRNAAENLSAAPISKPTISPPPAPIEDPAHSPSTQAAQAPAAMAEPEPASSAESANARKSSSRAGRSKPGELAALKARGAASEAEKAESEVGADLPTKTESPAKPEPQAAKPAPQAAKPTPQAGRRSAGAGQARRSAQKRAVATEVPKEEAKVAAQEMPADSMEDSILAAIAQAVDVLVEDRSTDNLGPVRGEFAPVAEPAGEDDAASDDIGDEIQRILASYSQSRDKRG